MAGLKPFRASAKPGGVLARLARKTAPIINFPKLARRRRLEAPAPIRSDKLEIETGHLLLRLADSARDLDASQALRYRVFYDEMQARPSAAMAALRRDFDTLDNHCDHLLVIDRASGEEVVVGTYRMIRRDHARAHGGFYTAQEFDIAKLDAYASNILEVGRSCVDARHRNSPTMQLLWAGIAAYVFRHDIKLLFGCASLPGTDQTKLAIPLAYLHDKHLAPPHLRVRALPDRYTPMKAPGAPSVDGRSAQSHLPPLIKGYLRLGGFVGDGAVIDEQFNTTDVCVVVPTESVTAKYYRHYERAGDRLPS